MEDDLKTEIREKQALKEQYSKLEANYKIAYKDQGDHDLKIREMEAQLNQRSVFEHQIIQKLEDLSEKYKLQNQLMKDVDLLNLELKTENEKLRKEMEVEREKGKMTELEFKLLRENQKEVNSAIRKEKNREEVKEVSKIKNKELKNAYNDFLDKIGQ